MSSLFHGPIHLTAQNHKAMQKAMATFAIGIFLSRVSSFTPIVQHFTVVTSVMMPVFK